MSIKINGPCGTTYHFKDEYGGQWVQCPTCRKVYQIPGNEDLANDPIRQFMAKRGPIEVQVADSKEAPEWKRKYIMDQVVWSLNEVYEFSEGEEKPTIGIAERADRFTNFISFALISAALYVAALTVGQRSEFGMFNLAILILFLTFILVTLISLRFKFVKRDIVFWADRERKTPAFFVRDLSRIEFPTAVFSVEDPQGQTIGFLKKGWWGDVLQSPWRVFSKTGDLILIAREESVVLSLLRRLFFTKLWWFRTNYVLLDPENEDTRGEFNRDNTLRDKYHLDLSSNQTPIDVRVLWALSVLLDSAERR